MSEQKKFELTPSVSILLAGVFIAGAIIFTNSNSQAAGGAAAEGAAGVAPTTQTNVRGPQADDHIMGSPTAPLVLIEYSDLQCYYCGQAYPTLKRLVEESNGQIAWIHRHLPLESIHPEAKPSALASECIAEQLGSDGFWKFAEAMFNNQQGMNAAYYEQVVGALGADIASFKLCVSSKKYASRVTLESDEAAKNGAQGTPYTILYDKKGQSAVSGALPYETFVSVIKAFTERQ